MNDDDIQRYRKLRLREAIDVFFDGKNISLARQLRNKDGLPLKDGSYVGHLLKPISEQGSRPIDEARVREIESLRPGLKGWFNLGSEPGMTPDGRSASVESSKRPIQQTSVYPTLGGAVPYLQRDDRNISDTNASTLVPQVVPWDQLEIALSKQYTGGGYRALAIPGQFGPNVQVIQYPDDSLEPEIQEGELIAVEPGLDPWPGDIVLARGKSTGVYFAGRYVSNRSGGYRIRSNKPDRYADADQNDADVVAVMVAKLSGRAGTKPVAIKGF